MRIPQETTTRKRRDLSSAYSYLALLQYDYLRGKFGNNLRSDKVFSDFFNKSTYEIIESAKIFHSPGLYQEAIKIYENLLQRYPLSDTEKGTIWFTIGSLYFLYGPIDKTITSLEKDANLTQSDRARLFYWMTILQRNAIGMP